MFEPPSPSRTSVASLPASLHIRRFVGQYLGQAQVRICRSMVCMLVSGIFFSHSSRNYRFGYLYFFMLHLKFLGMFGTVFDLYGLGLRLSYLRYN